MYSKGKSKLRQLDETLRALRDEARTGLASSEVRRSAIRAELDALREAKESKAACPPRLSATAPHGERGAWLTNKSDAIAVRQTCGVARVDANTQMTSEEKLSTTRLRSTWLTSDCEGVTLNELNDAHLVNASAELTHVVAALASGRCGLYESLRAIAEEYTYQDERSGAWDVAPGAWKQVTPSQVVPGDVQSGALNDSDDFFLLTQYMHEASSAAPASASQFTQVGQRRCAAAERPRGGGDVRNLFTTDIYASPPSRPVTDVSTTGVSRGLTRRPGGITGASVRSPSSCVSVSSTGSLRRTRLGAGRQPLLSHEGSAVVVNLAENIARSLQRQVARAHRVGERLNTSPPSASSTAEREGTSPETRMGRSVASPSIAAGRKTALRMRLLQRTTLVFCQHCGAPVVYDVVSQAAPSIGAVSDLSCARCGWSARRTICEPTKQDCMPPSCGATSSASTENGCLPRVTCFSTGTMTADGSLGYASGIVSPTLSASRALRWRASLAGLYYMQLNEGSCPL